MSPKEIARRWIDEKAEGLLRRAGLEKEQKVLDFGCHEGNYSIPAATVVGTEGEVYAFDKDQDKLKDLSASIRRKSITNVSLLKASSDFRIPLSRASVDVVLLYDVLHRGYFPEEEERIRVLESIHRVLKPGGLLSCYPTHLKQYGMTFNRVIAEVESVGFLLKGKAIRKLVHDERLVRGRVFSFIRE